MIRKDLLPLLFCLSGLAMGQSVIIPDAVKPYMLPIDAATKKKITGAAKEYAHLNCVSDWVLLGGVTENFSSLELQRSLQMAAYKQLKLPYTTLPVFGMEASMGYEQDISIGWTLLKSKIGKQFMASYSSGRNSYIIQCYGK